MPIRTTRYTPDELPPRHEDALLTAIDLLVDECFEDISALLDGADFSSVEMATYLPPKYLPRYTPQFAKQFLACILTVAWKLRAPGVHRLACVAEELALAAIIERARDVLEDQGVEPAFGAFEQCAFEDLDYELLFRPELDGIEDTAVGRNLAMANLHFGDWFSPFRDENPVHPYVADAPPSA